MKLNYYKDSLELDQSKASDGSCVAGFDSFTDTVRKSMKEIGINIQDVGIFYKRNSEGCSALGIQLKSGNSESLSNYLVYDCKPMMGNGKVFVNYDMHMDKTNEAFNLFTNFGPTKEITGFLTGVEFDARTSGEPNRVIDVMKVIPLNKRRIFSILRRKKSSSNSD